MFAPYSSIPENSTSNALVLKTTKDLFNEFSYKGADV